MISCSLIFSRPAISRTVHASPEASWSNHKWAPFVAAVELNREGQGRPMRMRLSRVGGFRSEEPGALGRIRARLTGCNDGDRQFVRILAAVLEDGLEAVEAACAEALACGTCSADVVLNILARHRQPPPPPAIPTPEGLQLRHQPVADCQRYDRLREAGHGAL